MELAFVGADTGTVFALSIKDGKKSGNLIQP